MHLRNVTVSHQSRPNCPARIPILPASWLWCLPRPHLAAPFLCLCHSALCSLQTFASSSSSARGSFLPLPPSLPLDWLLGLLRSQPGLCGSPTPSSLVGSVAAGTCGSHTITWLSQDRKKLLEGRNRVYLAAAGSPRCGMDCRHVVP